ncbi:T9SS type A sorting domain-containing protein [Zhouia spongiae]|uniref:T9SS type A sorting domain-containing protein n=1 Tax=Zhouia spongiae TaxID=2202721 RepID=A0ABY3YSN4_9FLAO|nr:T9SS type A sorting domain-containing protein [Zhouia spongiae]UNY99768.1 T9SS type A sorting domain-containing protein [Zhouia spongiae]
MKIKLLFILFITLFNTGQINSQNLLDTSSWTIGNGSVSGFGQNGSTTENSREYGIDPHGESSILWKASNDAESNADGGWNSSYHNIDHTKTYRFSVWIKKTNSNSGTTYFGTTSYSNNSHHILNLNNEAINTNPYFWHGDLPQLNKWYLIIGFVHGSNYDSTMSYGGIYDPQTGTKVANTTDFKFAETAVNVRHRSYLYYDTNTSNKQYFWAPRIDEVNGNELSIGELLGSNDLDTNLLNTSSWEVGTGSVSGFNQNGATSENSRVFGKNHVGDDVILWEATPDVNNNADGGWNSDYHNINHNTTYRFSVWIKKLNSNNGSTYLGCNSTDNILKLNGTVNNNPYFWAGDLPKLNRWYLIVGYVHKSSYTSTTNLGRIYDGVTGKEVKTITDYKFKNTAINVRHRSYLYYDTNTSDRQYFWAPRIDPVTGNEPTINELLQINENSKLILSYDIAGNQKQRFYCEEEGFCSPKAPTSRKVEDMIVAETTEELAQLAPNPTIEEEEKDLIEYYPSIYPNPTNGRVSIQLSGVDYNLTGSINIYSSNGSLVKSIQVNSPTNQIELNISTLSSGTYLVHMHFTNGTVTTQQIIKN